MRQIVVRDIVPGIEEPVHPDAIHHHHINGRLNSVKEAEAYHYTTCQVRVPELSYLYMIKSTYIFDVDYIFQEYDPLSMSFLYYILPSCSYNFVVDVPDVNCTCADVVPLIST
jgi:hypothetical protein